MNLIDKEYLEELKEAGNWGKPDKRRERAVYRATSVIKSFGEGSVMSTMDAQAFGIYPVELTRALAAGEINGDKMKAEGEHRTHRHIIIDHRFVEWLWNRSWGSAYKKDAPPPLPTPILDALTAPDEPAGSNGRAESGAFDAAILEAKSRHWNRFGYSIYQSGSGRFNFTDYNKDPTHTSRWFSDLEELDRHLKAYHARKGKGAKEKRLPVTPPKETAAPQDAAHTVAALASGGRDHKVTVRVSAFRRFFARLAGFDLPKTVEVTAKKR